MTYVGKAGKSVIPRTSCYLVMLLFIYPLHDACAYTESL
jgi:hypothetical protein